MTSPLLLGHRGARASRQIPENTLASFELCLQHGCDGFEFDVRRSADGQAVICHDPESGGLAIARTPAQDLALPTLEEVLRSFSSRAFLDIELKVGGLEREVLALLRDHPPRKGYVISSFLPEALTLVHDLDASVPLGFICEQRSRLVMERGAPSPVRPGMTPGGPLDLSAAWVIPQVDMVDRELVDQVHAAGQQIMIWTANRADQMRQQAQWGVDAIISDEAELLVRSLRR